MRAPAYSVNLYWQDRSNNELNFVLEKRIMGGAWAIQTNPPANSLFYTDTSVQLGRTYSYRIRAYNPNGYSAYSNEETVTIE